MKMKILAVALLAALPAGAAEPPAATRAAFDRLKALDGAWEGEAKGAPVEVTYRLASNGSVVFEDLFPGTSHEMISMYHLDGANLVMTHYCAMGNQPRMRLSAEGSSADELRFDFAGGTNLNPETDTHVHSGRIRFLAPDKIEAEWAVYQGTKQVGSNKFVLSRKKS
jgi:hypothetical protein